MELKDGRFVQRTNRICSGLDFIEERTKKKRILILRNTGLFGISFPNVEETGYMTPNMKGNTMSKANSPPHHAENTVIVKHGGRSY